MALFNKKVLAILGLILILAAFLRFWKLDNQSFIADEYIGINVSYGYHHTGQWKYWDFLKDELSDRDYTRGKTYYWQVAQVFNFFHPGEGSARFVSALWGMLGVGLIFLISYHLTKKKSVALVSAFLLSVSISALTFDRKLRMYSMFAPVYLGLIWSIYQLLETKPKKFFSKINDFSCFLGINLNYLPIALIMFYFSLKTHLLTVNVIPTVLIYFIVQWIILWKKNKKFLNKYGVYLLVILIFFLAALPSDTVRGALAFFSFWINNWSYFDKLTLDYSSPILATTVFAFGLYFLIKNYGKKGLWYSLAFVVPFLLAVMAWKRNAGHQYIYFIQPLKIIILSSGIYFIAEQFRKKFFSRRQAGFYLATGYLLFSLVNFGFFFSKDSFYYETRRWTYPNYKQAYQYFLNHRAKDSVLITRKIMEYNLFGENLNGVTVFNYGDEDFGNNRDKLTLNNVIDLQKQYDEIWLINTDNEFSIKGDARQYIEENFQLIETKYTNDIIRIWRWQVPSEPERKTKVHFEDKALEFGLVTDVHCYSKQNEENQEWEVNWRCQLPMESFAKQMNEEKPDFVIQLGDLVDGRDKQREDGFLKAKQIFDTIEVDKYNVLGNHETDNFPKKEWLGYVGYQKPYYFFDKKGYRMIVLDANFVELGNDKVVDMSPDTPHSYRGLIDQAQLNWLNGVLAGAQKGKAIIFVHEPPLDQTLGEVRDDIFVNAKDLREVLTRNADKVLAVFSGHIEELCDVEIGGVQYYTLQGFHKQNDLLTEKDQFKDAGSYYDVTITNEGKIFVEMFYKKTKESPYRSFLVNQQTAVCNNNSLPIQN